MNHDSDSPSVVFVFDSSHYSEASRGPFMDCVALIVAPVVACPWAASAVAPFVSVGVGVPYRFVFAILLPSAVAWCGTPP